MRIVIIGAGPGGLAAAHTLQAHCRPRPEIIILEAGDQAGGLASGFRGSPAWSWPLERYYHHLFTNDLDIIRFTRELGLDSMLEVHDPVTAYFHAGKAYRLDSVRHLLAFPHLAWPAKVRMGLVLAWLRGHPRLPWHRLDTVTAHQWLRTWMGPQAYATLWQSLLEGKFGARYRDISLAWFAARIRKRTPRLGYFRGGFQAWFDAVLDILQTQGVQTSFQTRVENITGKQGSLEIRTSRGTWEAQAVLHTGSPGLLAQMCAQLPDAYVRQVRRETYMGAVVLILALDRSVTDGTYWISIPANAGLPFLALVEHTAMISPVHYGGQHLVYLGAYVDVEHRYLHMDEADLTREFLQGLARINPAIEAASVRGSWLHRTAYAQPVPYPGAGQTRLPLRTPVSGLYLATMSQVWPWDRGTNYAVALGQEAARQMARDLVLASD